MKTSTWAGLRLFAELQLELFVFVSMVPVDQQDDQDQDQDQSSGRGPDDDQQHVVDGDLLSRRLWEKDEDGEASGEYCEGPHLDPKRGRSVSSIHKGAADSHN